MAAEYAAAMAAVNSNFPPPVWRMLVHPEDFTPSYKSSLISVQMGSFSTGAIAPTFSRTSAFTRVQGEKTAETNVVPNPTRPTSTFKPGRIFDMTVPYNADISLAKKGGNRSKQTFSGKEVNVVVKDGICVWKPRCGYQAQIDQLTTFICALPPSSWKAEEDIGIHPLLGVTRFVMTSDQNDAAARLLYPKRTTKEKKNKALGQLLCYLGMMSEHCAITHRHYVRFSKTDWNKNGYRLRCDTKGLPTIIHVNE
jgi:predicted Fe-Mo cluster-binding NifX family protein